MPELRDDLLPTIDAIAEYVYGEANKITVRRIRHLIDRHGFPAKKAGGKLSSKKSWIEAHYAEPDAPRNGART